jgi:hypothetical protein
MSRPTRLVLVLVALALFAAMLLLGRRGGDRADTAMPAGATPVEIEVAPPTAAPVAARAAAPAVPATTAAGPAPAPVRARIPRPPSLPALPDPAAAPAGGADTDTDGPIDRRGPGAPAVKKAELFARLDTISDDIEECLASWKELDPRIDATAMLAFQIGPAGLTDVWLAEHAELPAAAATCFSSAVYAIDWAGLTEAPIEITQRYQDGAQAIERMQAPHAQ